MADFKNSTLLVTGASGKFGRLAVKELLAKGATKVIAGSRDTTKVADLVAKGAEARTLDFDDVSTLASAFAGVDRVLIVSTDGIGRRIEQHKAAIAAAKAAGVKHIAYTSAPAARPNLDSGLGVEHYWTEVALAESGLDFTSLRNHMYAENNLADAAYVIASGKLLGLHNDRGTAYVTRADAARTAAGALLTAEGKIIEDVSGPEAVTNTARAALYAQMTGKPVVVAPLNQDELTAALSSAGLPEAFAKALVAFQHDAVEGFHGVVTDAVERYTGRKPQSFAEFLEANRAALTA